MSTDDDAAAVGRRIRAALVMVGRAPGDLAPELNISMRTLDRTLAGERQARDWEIRRIAELVPVPEWFLRDGLERPPAPTVTAADVVERLDAIDRRLDVSGVEDRLAGLEESLRELAQLCGGIRDLVERR